MKGFYRQQYSWFVDGVRLKDIANEYHTPCYVYSHSLINDNYKQLQTQFCHSQPKICYAVKANDNLSILNILAKANAGFDIVSGGELKRVLVAGGRAKDIVFSGVGKSQAEIEQAQRANIGCFNVESADELKRIEKIAVELKQLAPVAIRLNLDIDANTHRHLTTGLKASKFGVLPHLGQQLAKTAYDSKHLDFLGFSCHVGSQIKEQEVYLKLAQAMAKQVNIAQNNGMDVRQVDMGGGFAVDDQSFEKMPFLKLWSDYDKCLATLFANKTVLIEPGRCLIATAGVLLTRVEYLKETDGKTLWVCDGGMTDLLRPALYGAHHLVVNAIDNQSSKCMGDVVGPVCESADILVTDCHLDVKQDDILVFFNTGAYGLVMASNYNARVRPAAILVANGQSYLIRQRETIAQMMQCDTLPKLIACLKS